MSQDRLASTWRQADPDRIAHALEIAESRDPAGWFVAAAADEIPRHTSVVRRLAGREVVLWRGEDGGLHAGPGACPHLGASLHDCPVSGSTMRCRWHGLALTPNGNPSWRTYAAHDDGVLAWVRLPEPSDREPSDREPSDREPSDRRLIDAPAATPTLPERPPLDRSLSAVITMQGRCEPRDIIANRLDPWHGSWFHPYAFSHLTVDDLASSPDRLIVDVTFRLGRTFGVPVRAAFFCPDARTIVMQIIDGEGAGSVVETHATPIGTDEYGAPITQITEATIACADRSGFRTVTRLAPLVRPLMRHTARRLWVDDLVYAERLYRVRTGEVEGPTRSAGSDRPTGVAREARSGT